MLDIIDIIQATYDEVTTQLYLGSFVVVVVLNIVVVVASVVVVVVNVVVVALLVVTDHIAKLSPSPSPIKFD